MPVVQYHDAISGIPTEDAPERGVICSDEGVVVSEALHWVDDGDHVFRSTEFDVIAGDADLQTAVDKFVQNAEDLANFYVEIKQDLTEGELEQALTLLKRYAEVYRAANDRLAGPAGRRLLDNLLRRRGRSSDPHRGGFRPALTP